MDDDFSQIGNDIIFIRLTAFSLMIFFLLSARLIIMILFDAKYNDNAPFILSLFYLPYGLFSTGTTSNIPQTHYARLLSALIAPRDFAEEKEFDFFISFTHHVRKRKGMNAIFIILRRALMRMITARVTSHSLDLYHVPHCQFRFIDHRHLVISKRRKILATCTHASRYL